MENSLVKKEKKIDAFYFKVRKKITKWFESGRLAKKTGSWTDSFVQYLLVFPDLVYLMIKLLFDKEVPSIFRGYIIIVMTYLLSPIDIIPDFIPVVGFVDDLLVVIVVLNKIINSGNKIVIEKIKQYWAGEEDLFLKVKEIIAIMNELSSRIPRSIYNFIKLNKK